MCVFIIFIFSNELAAGQQRCMTFHYNLPKPAATHPFFANTPPSSSANRGPIALLRPDPRRPLLPPLFLSRLNCADPFLQPLSLPIPPPMSFKPSPLSSLHFLQPLSPGVGEEKKKRGTVKLLWSLGCNEKVFNAFPSFKWQGVHGGRSRKADLTAPGRERAMMC